MKFRHAIAPAALLLAFSSAAWANSIRVSPKELAGVINRARPSDVHPTADKLSPHDIRRVRCIGPDEEPTEFDCRWEQHTRRGWVKRSTWIAIDGDHLVSID
jgi:hypothetical protein